MVKKNVISARFSFDAQPLIASIEKFKKEMENYKCPPEDVEYTDDYFSGLCGQFLKSMKFEQQMKNIASQLDDIKYNALKIREPIVGAIHYNNAWAPVVENISPSRVEFTRDEKFDEQLRTSFDSIDVLDEEVKKLGFTLWGKCPREFPNSNKKIIRNINYYFGNLFEVDKFEVEKSYLTGTYAFELRLKYVKEGRSEDPVQYTVQELVQENKNRNTCIKCESDLSQQALLSGVINYCKKCCG